MGGGLIVGFVAKRARLELCEDCIMVIELVRYSKWPCISSVCTSETVDCPLLELLEGDVCRGRRRVEVEPVGILLLFVPAVDELLLAVVDMPPFGVYPVEVLPEHFDGRVESKKTIHDPLILCNTKAVCSEGSCPRVEPLVGRRAWTRCAKGFH